MTLFRKEVQESRQTDRLGPISLSQPPEAWIFTVVASVLAASVVLFALLGTYRERFSAQGVLTPDRGFTLLTASSDGVVERVNVGRGAKIGAKQALMVVATKRVTADGVNVSDGAQKSMLRRIASRSEAQQADLLVLERQQSAGRERLARLQATFESMQKQVRIREAQLVLARSVAERYQRLGRSSLISELQLTQQEQAVLGLELELNNAINQLSIVRGQIEDARSEVEVSSLKLRGMRAAGMAELALLRQEQLHESAGGSLSITSPVAGYVADIWVHPSQQVKPGDPLVSIVTAGSRMQARLLVPSSVVGHVRPGSRVIVKFRAYPHQKYGVQHGTVAEVSTSPLGEADADGTARFQVLVRLDRQHVSFQELELALFPGMEVDADILGEKRSVFDWISKPVRTTLEKVSE